MKSPTQAAWAVAGPPTRNRRSTTLSALPRRHTVVSRWTAPARPSRSRCSARSTPRSTTAGLHRRHNDLPDAARSSRSVSPISRRNEADSAAVCTRTGAVSAMRPAPWHEAQFNKGTHAVCQEAVVNLVNVRPVIYWLPVGSFAVDAVLVVEDIVKANVAEVGDRLRRLQVLAPASRIVRFARPEPNVCSQKCGNGLRGAPASMRMTSGAAARSWRRMPAGESDEPAECLDAGLSQVRLFHGDR